MTVAIILRRVGMLLLVVWAASTLIFFVPRLAPTNPVRDKLLAATEQGASQKPGAPQPPVKEEEDPFAGVTVQPKPEEKPKESGRSWRESFFEDNFGFRKEIMSQFNTNQDGDLASRQSLGFEVLKKFSTATAPVFGGI
jgi:ABC-type dipeptide/oligopeptide/nickel transport system permease component